MKVTGCSETIITSLLIERKYKCIKATAKTRLYCFCLKIGKCTSQ